MEYEDYLEHGWCPIWSGFLSSGEELRSEVEDMISKGTGSLWIKLAKGSERVWSNVEFPLEHDPDYEPLIKQTALDPGSKIGILAKISTAQDIERVGAILGYGPFSMPGPGLNTGIKAPIKFNVCGLDIEQSTYYRDGKFPLPTDPLISICIYTSDDIGFCGYCIGNSEGFSMKDCKSVTTLKFLNSNELADWAIEWLIDNEFDFVAIHNGYNYDVTRLAAHCSFEYSHLFHFVNLGKVRKGMNISIPGKTLIDTHFYNDKLHRNEYENMSLNALASAVGEASKYDSPSMMLREDDKDVNVDKMLEYCLHDARLHARVALKSSCLSEIISICPTFKCTMSDAAKFISGTLVQCVASSYALSLGKVIDWSPEVPSITKYKGALVLPPSKGIHKHVVVLDVTSMYPSLMIAGNISPETVETAISEQDIYQISQQQGRLLNKTDGSGLVDWNVNDVIIVNENVISKTDRYRDGIFRQMLTFLIKERMRVGKKTQEGWSKKILINSSYGATGSKTSGLGSREGAASVTTMGRWLLTSMVAIATGIGMKVVYGDTDSVFLDTSASKISTGVNPNFASNISSKYPGLSYQQTQHKILGSMFVSIFKTVMKYTPFGNIDIDIEESYDKLILVSPKMYYGIKSSSTGMSSTIKGLAPTRKDRIPLARALSSAILEILCSDDTATLESRVVKALLKTQWLAESGRVAPEAMCIEKKKDGIPCLEYVDTSGKRVMIRRDDLTDTQIDIDKSWVRDTIYSSVSPILAACGFAQPEELVRRYIYKVK